MRRWCPLFENTALCVLSFVLYSNRFLIWFETAILKIYLRTWIASKRPRTVIESKDNSGLIHRTRRYIDRILFIVIQNGGREERGVRLSLPNSDLINDNQEKVMFC